MKTNSSIYDVRRLGLPAAADPLELSPEFVDVRGLRRMFGIGRSLAYELIDRGEIRSVSLRATGKLRGKRLFDVASVRDYLLAHEDKRNGIKQGTLEAETRTESECSSTYRLKKGEAPKPSSDATAPVATVHPISRTMPPPQHLQ